VRWQREGAQACEEAGLLLVAGSRRFPAGAMNCAARIDRAVAPAEALARAARFFVARDRGFSWYLRDPVDGDLAHAAAAAGLATIATMPWMTIDRPIAEAPLPDGVLLRFAEKDARVSDDAVAIRAEAYESLALPPAITESLFSARTADPATRVVVAYAGDVAAATAMLLPSHGVAGVYWVATVKAMRGRGLGEACTRTVTNAGLAAGARFASLQASPMGAPIYTRLGYVTRWNSRWVLVTREQARALAR
jgi:hypothetical protein